MGERKDWQRIGRWYVLWVLFLLTNCFNSFVLGAYVWKDQRRDGTREGGEG